MVERFDSTWIFEGKYIPLYKDADVIKVAITDPLDAWALKKLEEETKGYALKLALVSEKDMEGIIERFQKHLRGKSQTGRHD